MLAVVAPKITSAAAPSALEFVGNVDLVDEKGATYTGLAERPRIVGFNKASGDLLIVQVWRSTLVSLDPVTLKQTGVVKLGGFDFTSSSASVYDDASQTLFYTNRPCFGQPCTMQSRLRAFDVSNPSRSFTLTLPASTGGASVVALRTLVVDGRNILYALLHTDACCYTTSLVSPARNTLLALDITSLKPDAEPTPLWSYDLPAECDDFPTRNPAYLGIARDNAFAYFLCLGQIPAGQRDYHQTPHLAMVVDFHEQRPHRQDPAAFTTSSSVFPGALPKGLSIGDATGERVMALIANGANNQLYVFDARHRAWTGSVPLSGNTNLWGGAVDQDTGRIYVVQESNFALITEGDAVPIPQGHEHDLGTRPVNGEDYPFFEPRSRRLFILGPSFREPDGREVLHSLRVYRDRLPPPPKRVERDPDAGTDDVPEVPGQTPVAFSGGSSAYGARVALVGGFANSQAGSYLQQLNATFAGISSISSAVCGEIPDGSPSTFNEVCGVSGPPQVSGNDRVFVLGRVEQAQLTDSAATAATAGAAYDESTQSELHNLGVDGAVAENAPETVPSQCGDTEGKRAEDQHTGSSVACDLSKQEVVAAAAYQRETSEGGPRIGSGSATTRIERGSNGVVAVSEAVARDIDLPIPPSVLKTSCTPSCPAQATGGRVHIDEVRNVARTSARGRTGSARSTLTPELRGVTIFDSAGSPVYSCDPCVVEEVAARLRAESPDALGVFVPPRVGGRLAESPKGAQALVVKDHYAYWSDRNINNDPTKEVPALQLVYYNDSDRPSRLVVQLAAVLAESHYTVGLPGNDVPTTPGDPRMRSRIELDGETACAPDDAACATGGGGDGGTLGGLGGAGRGPGEGQGLTELLGGFLRQGLGQALLLGLVWLLLGTPAYLSYRRRSLLSMQQEEAFS